LTGKAPLSPIITLTTDFGLHDGYVASIKGAILNINPDAVLVDICHTIEPQFIEQAAFVLASACHVFPPGTIHLVVVDPGVGTERRALAIKTPGASFVAPDNGVLTHVITRAMEEAHFVTRGVTSESSTQLDIGDPVEGVNLTNRRYWRQTVSNTFHGRDVFAPVAAHLSLNVPLGDMGEAVKSITVFPIARCHTEPDGTLTGKIIYVDHFGNLITNITSHDLPKGEVAVQTGNRTIAGLSRTYGDGEELLALIGSDDRLEIAVRKGNAEGYLNAHIGDEVRVKAVPVPEERPAEDKTS